MTIISDATNPENRTMTLNQPTSSKSKRRWFQYSLRTLLIFVTLFAVACSWFAVKMQQARRQREAVEAIVKAGGIVKYDHQLNNTFADELYDVKLGESKWKTRLRRVFGDELVETAVSVQFWNPENKHISVMHVKELVHLKTLLIEHGQLSDDDTKHFKGLIQLVSLDLIDCSISDNGLDNIKEFTQLRDLNLERNQITDAGLMHLKMLKELRSLYIDGNNITDSVLAASVHDSFWGIWYRRLSAHYFVEDNR